MKFNLFAKGLYGDITKDEAIKIIDYDIIKPIHSKQKYI